MQYIYTGTKENSEYSAQITPYQGYVYAEIISSKKNKDKFNDSSGLWLAVMSKRFGSRWRSAPREEDWIKANDWINEQLELINKYGTVVVTKPDHIRDIERQGLHERMRIDKQLNKN